MSKTPLTLDRFSLNVEKIGFIKIWQAWSTKYICDNISLNSSEKKSDKICRDNQNILNIPCSRKSDRVWDNMKKYDGPRQALDNDIIRHMRFAYWINKATNTHSEFVILFVFPLEKWCRERAWMLRLYVYWLSCCSFNWELHTLKICNFFLTATDLT
jgi:hypothetical protein